MASQCCDRTSSSSFSSSSSCFSAAKRDTAAVSTALPQFNSSVRYSEQLACELETKEETAVEVEDHDDPLVCTISLPQTELRTRPAGGCNGQTAALASGRFDGTAVATTKGRTDSEPRVLLLSFGPSDGWSEASRLQKTMGTKKHSAEGFRKENAMEKRESKEAYVWPTPTPSSEANWTIQWANPRPVLTPVSTAAPDEGNLLCDISFNDFITRVAIPPPPPPTPPSLVAVETQMNVPKPPPLPDFAGRRLNFRSAKTTDRLIHSLDPTISKDQKKYGGVCPALKPSGDVQLSPSTIQRIQMEYAAVVSRGGSHQLNLYGPMTENDAAYVSLEEDFAKLVTPPPPPHQMTRNGLEIQRPPVPPPPPPVSVGVSHPPLLLTLPPHPPPNRSSGRGHTLASPSFPNRRPPSATTPPGSHKVFGVEAMNGFDETRLRPSSAPHRNVDASSKDKTKDADNQKETNNAAAVAAAAAAAAVAAMSLSHESLSNVSARVEANSFSTGVAIKQQTTYYSRTHNNSATLPRTAPPTPPPRLNSAIDSNSAMDKRPPRRVSFDECPVQIEGPGRRENCSPPSSNTKRSSRRDSCSNPPPPPPPSTNDESTTRKSRRNESTTLPQSSSLSRLITAATSWVGCRQPHSESTAQIRPHAIRSSSSSAFQSIVKDSNEPSDALVAEAGAGTGSGRSVRSGSFGGGDASSANVSVFSNFKSKLKSYWSPSMSKRKSFVQRSSIDQSSVVVSSSSSSSRRSSSIDVVDYAQENPDGNPYKTMVGPRRRSSSRSRMEVKVASVVGLRPPAAAEDGDDAHDLDHLPSLKQNTQSTFKTFTGMPVS